MNVIQTFFRFICILPPVSSSQSVLNEVSPVAVFLTYPNVYSALMGDSCPKVECNIDDHDHATVTVSPNMQLALLPQLAPKVVS